MNRAEALRAEINKAMGGNVLQMGSDRRYVVEYMPTGLLPIDIMLNGGIPRDRFVTLTGAYSTLKSYIGLKAIAAIQADGGLCALIDTEHAFDPAWAERLGVNLKELILWPPLEESEEVTGEEAFDMANLLVVKKVDFIVFDSVAASLPQQEQSKRLSKESVQPGRLAALMSLAMRKLTAPNQKTGILFINQLREQIGVMFGNPEKATGGRALPYYSSIILNVRTAGWVTETAKVFDGDQNKSTKRKIGQSFVIQVQKSKLSTPWTDLFFDYDMRKSEIDMPKFLFAQGVELGEITKKGNAWTYLGVTGASKEKFIGLLASREDLQASLEEAIRTHHGLPSLGSRVPVSRKGSALRRSSSSSAGRKLTPAAGRAASKTTAAPRKKLSR
jgi:recombination protein RecA